MLNGKYDEFYANGNRFTMVLIFMVVSQSSRDALFSPVILVEALTALVTSGIFVAVSQKFFPTDRASTVMGTAEVGRIG